MVAQGEIWLLESVEQKSRPVLVVSRNEVIPVVNNVVVAPLTTTIREIPTCIPLSSDHGVERDCVASFDNATAVPKSMLTRRLGDLGLASRRLICSALEALADC